MDYFAGLDVSVKETSVCNAIRTRVSCYCDSFATSAFLPMA
jgi:hypothetical protein